MKKYILLFTAAFFAAGTLHAVQAFQRCIEFKQPDGQTFQGCLKGDEHFHWIELENGSIAVYNAQNRQFEYGKVGRNKHNESDLLPSGIPVSDGAEDAAKRSSTRAALQLELQPVNQARLRSIWKQKRKERLKHMPSQHTHP